MVGVSAHHHKRRRIDEDDESVEPGDNERNSSDQWYSYDQCPLAGIGDIRIVTISRGSGKDQVECTLSTRPLLDPAKSSKSSGERKQLKKYEALSYHWGIPEDEEIIKVYTTGDPFPKLFKVTPNLHSALVRLRRPDRERTLWVDAICINQRNTSEQNAQVSMLAEIYREATHVCVWLGQESEDSEMAVQFIKRVVNLDDFDRLVVDPTVSREWGALLALMKRKLFSRRWVVQEIAMAQRATLYCGNAEADWSDFVIAVSLFEAAETKGRVISKSLMNSAYFNHIPDYLGDIKSLGVIRLVDATSNLFRKPSTGQVLERLSTIDALISNLSILESSRAHDVIYAVLALSKDTHMSAMVNGERQIPRLSYLDGQESFVTEPSQALSASQTRLAQNVSRQIRKSTEVHRFTIDYDKDFFEVCKDFLKFTIHGSKSLDIICRPWAPEDGFPEEKPAPSWLLTMSRAAFGPRPDGSYSRKHADTLVGTPGVGKRNYSASGSLEVTNQWSFGEGPTDCRSMYVEGFVIDGIVVKKPSAMEGIIPNSWLEAGGWKDKSALPPEPFWRTLVADRGPNGVNPPAFYPRACRTALNKSVQGSHISTGTLVHSGKSEFVAEFLRRVHEVIWSRRLITSTHGLLGLGPDSTKRGDLICILYGCSVPVVLRPLEDEVTKKAYFEFVGECYVHGIMDGEAFDMARRWNANEQIEKKIFELR